MSRAYRILRAFGYLRLAQRYYAVHRVPNHYQVLGVPSNASKKDIRAAYLQLSKQNHPDTSHKEGHADFLKITEAYDVLSKDSTRQEYDEHLKYARVRRHSAYQNPYGPIYPRAHVYRTKNPYSESNFEEWRDNFHQMNARYGVPNWDEQSGPYRARQTASNTTIVLLCILFAAFGVGLQVLAVFVSPAFDREKLLQRSEEYAQIHRKIRNDVELNLTRQDSVRAFRRRIGADPSVEQTDEVDSVEV